MENAVTVQFEGDVAVVVIDNPPINAGSLAVRRGLVQAIDQVSVQSETKAAVLIGAGKTFVAGADIREFGAPVEDPSLPDVIARIERCPLPVVAAIHGTAFGGGLETALVCHYRVASPSAQVGQPEVKLGLIPGAGGTQRLPRLAGVAKAAEMCAGGQPIGAAEAAKYNIVDRVIEGELLAGAVAFAREIAARGGPPRKTRDLNEKLADRAANRSCRVLGRPRPFREAAHLDGQPGRSGCGGHAFVCAHHGSMVRGVLGCGGQGHDRGAPRR